MKLLLKNPEGFVEQRLSILKKERPCLDTNWHYHPEFELLYVAQSNGIRFVGDNVEPFSNGDLVLVGSYLPHLWRNDLDYYTNQDDRIKVKTIVIKFMANFIGEGTFDYPEFINIKRLLEQSKFGLCFGEKISKDLHQQLSDIVDLPNPTQSIKLLELLNYLSQTEDKRELSSTDMRQYIMKHSHRLDEVLKYISDHYTNTIMLSEIAEIACMTTNSFCRFFKKKMNKSFTQFLNEVRIRNASRLLMQEDLPISEVCYKVGYNSLTNFNKQFKQIMGCTPKKYRSSILTH